MYEFNTQHTSACSIELLRRPNDFNIGCVKFFRARSISSMDEGASEHPGLRMTIAHKQILDTVSGYTWDQSDANNPHKQLFPESEEWEIEESTRVSRTLAEADL